MNCLGWVLVAVIIFLSLLLNTCVSDVEVTRATSPDGRVIASVHEINGGATTDFAYRVDMARAWPLNWTHHAASFYGAVRNDCAYGIDIRWKDDDTLLVTYLEAKSENSDPSVNLIGRTVRIVTKSGVTNAAAPCGGMEYSQEGKVVRVG